MINFSSPVVKGIIIGGLVGGLAYALGTRSRNAITVGTATAILAGIGAAT